MFWMPEMHRDRGHGGEVPRAHGRAQLLHLHWRGAQGQGPLQQNQELVLFYGGRPPPAQSVYAPSQSSCCKPLLSQSFRAR